VCRAGERDLLEVELAGLDLGEVEDVVDQVQQRVGRLLRRAADSALLRASAERLQQQLGHADDAVHRRADLVAHVGEELALRARRALGRVARGAQLPSDALSYGAGRATRRASRRWSTMVSAKSATPVSKSNQAARWPRSRSQPSSERQQHARRGAAGAREPAAGRGQRGQHRFAPRPAARMPAHSSAKQSAVFSAIGMCRPRRRTRLTL
jgi:hypothetical protein